MKKIIDSLILSPLSFIWGRFYAFRRFLYEYGMIKREYYKVPIISVGNLSFGGTGKTPFIIWLVKEIEKQNKSSLILTRGYKGKLENSKGIISSKDVLGKEAFLYGDEPYLIARRSANTHVVVGSNRAKNLEHYFPEVLPDVVLLDDGYQHLKLFRDLNIVLFDSLQSFESYRCAPAGYLRENLSALRYADYVLFSRAKKVDITKLKELEVFLRPHMSAKTPIGYFDYKCEGIFDKSFKKTQELSFLNNRNIIFLSAIASPESFYKIIDGIDFKLLDQIEFSDHHDYRADEIEQLVKRAEEEDALIITTEKDFVKINKLTDSERVLYLSISLDFLSGENELIEEVRKLLSIA